jgi:pyruvate,water dikinase
MASRLLRNDAVPSEHDRHAREQDAGSANSSAIRATEDVLSGRQACSKDRGFVFQQPPSTGLPGLDEVLQGLRPGDNVVWMIEDVQDYAPLIVPYCQEARRSGMPPVYFHFARHVALLEPSNCGRFETIDPEGGFDQFVGRVLQVIEQVGTNGCFIFDCLSDLAADWFSDRMLGNFFMIVCPYLHRLGATAYFALMRQHHSMHATEPISDTANVVLEVFRSKDRLFIQPVKVEHRHSPTMYMLHFWGGDTFAPVTSSSTIAEVLSTAPKPWLEFTFRRVGIWGQTFQDAQATVEALKTGVSVDAAVQDELFGRLLRMMLTHEPRFERLAKQYFDLPQLVEIIGRMIGTGMIGGKSLGMLLARAILKASGPEWSRLLESHDSFYIGSDVFYTYLVQNDCWWLRRMDTDFESYLSRAAQVRERILAGGFPKYIVDQFEEMLDYFGQSPLIVRSSSLLEDSYGNAFSGKYDSVFLANQGAPEERLQAFLDAVRTVYASTMNEPSLTYRQYRNVLDRDEQMALLIQRVSGEMHGQLFFPQAAGVGFSFNPFVWQQDIDPEAGVLRLVLGLGTRAVDRTDDDYTRLVALNKPLRQPGNGSPQLNFSQRRVDVLDLAGNKLATRTAEEVTALLPPALQPLFVGTTASGQGGGAPDMLTFEGLLSHTGFAPSMKELCRLLEEAYEYPVDVEFTVNFTSDHEFRLNLLQCRPFQVKIEGEVHQVRLPDRLPPERVILETHGPIIGHSRDSVIDSLLYVRPEAYSELSMSDRYSLGRLIGRVVHILGAGERAQRIMLVGPGRWGTSMPSLGLPVTFNEIRKASVICELAMMHGGLVPDVSLGTHFFNDIVELDMLYLAIAPGRRGYTLNEQLVLDRRNQLAGLLPEADRWSGVLQLVDSGSWDEPGSIVLNVDSLRQHAVCHWRSGSSSQPAS